jgi:2-polyprenyl-3-methyl-5-hydroxy-6-metoxy-1,4-benzoquinol methylase
VSREIWNQQPENAGNLRRPNYDRAWYRYACELLALLPAPDRTGRALDVGCGVGEFMLKLRDAGLAVEGVDGNEAQLLRVRARGLPARVAELEQGLPFEDGRFSVVSCLEVIEHLGRAELALFEMHRVLRPGGHLLLSTPNFSSLNNRLRYLWGAGPDNEGVHLRFFTRQRLEECLLDAGFRMLARRSYGVVPALSRLSARMRNGAPLLWPVPTPLESLMAYDFVYLARRGDD